MHESLLSQPQLTTTSRLLELGESVTFEFHLAEGTEAGPLHIFPRYLERARPGKRFTAGGSLDWLDSLTHEIHALRFADGRASLTYQPAKPGSYLARWRAGGEAFYRHFCAIEDDWVVLRFSTFGRLEAEPTLHATGIPLDYRLPAERFTLDDPLCRKLVDYHRHYGDTVVPHLPDTPEATHEERVALYREMIDRARALLPDGSDVRSARLEMRHDTDPGYTRGLAEVGVNDHCGLNEANAKPWLGMPEFPYFASPVDCRKVNQAEGGDVVAHQWDFCGGWHFVGPVSWHYKAAAGDWSAAKRCIEEGMDELALLAELSGHPAFAVPLYDGLEGPGYPNPAFEYSVADSRAFSGSVAGALVLDRALSPREIADLVELGRPDTDATLHFTGDGEAAVMDEAPALDRAELTLACWVKPGATQRPWANLLSSHNNDGMQNLRGVSLEQDGHNTNRFYLIGGTGQSWAGADTTTQLAPGEWQHFAVVREGAKLTHYLNGEPSAEGALPAAPFVPATDPFRIGDWARGGGGDEGDMLGFVERYQRLIAFRFPKRRKVAFARSVDIADYFRRHFRRTPRTVFVSRTDHVQYDKWWLCNWCAEGLLVPREQIPWSTRISTIMRRRREEAYWKDPLSYEYMLVEDHGRQIRFERECPNPVWWFDYAEQTRGPEGSTITHTETPDVDVRCSEWTREGDRLSIRLTMRAAAGFPDYAIALWSLPAEFDPQAPIRTNAKEHILARNRAGEHHLVLVVDLEPNVELTVALRARSLP